MLSEAGKLDLLDERPAEDGSEAAGAYCEVGHNLVVEICFVLRFWLGRWCQVYSYHYSAVHLVLMYWIYDYSSESGRSYWCAELQDTPALLEIFVFDAKFRDWV